MSFSDTQGTTSTDGIRIEVPRDLPDPHQELQADVRAGLYRPPRELSPKYLYDAEGSRLYEEITRLPEYYPFRTEQGILTASTGEIAAESRSEVVVEFGSGSADKTRILLDELWAQGLLEGYGAIEVSRTALESSLRGLAAQYEDIACRGVVADFNEDVTLPFSGARRLLLFLGSTIGNLDEGASLRFVKSVAEAMERSDRFLVGFDLVKDEAVIERAYNDAAGVTARFNLNLLTRLNRELGADFDRDAFRHRAFFDPGTSRVEMHLVARSEQEVDMGEAGFRFRMDEGESIRTEISRKFRPEQVKALASQAGLERVAWYTDEREYFGVAVFRRARASGPSKGPDLD